MPGVMRVTKVASPGPLFAKLSFEDIHSTGLGIVLLRYFCPRFDRELFRDAYPHIVAGTQDIPRAAGYTGDLLTGPAAVTM